MITKQHLTEFATEITGCEIIFKKQTKFGKWYECEYTSEFEMIETGSSYGVCINGHAIDFDFKTGKTEDSFFKSFINQFITKYEMKRMVFIDGEIRRKTREECVKEFRNNKRVYKSCFYTTLYGIGFFSFFMSQETILDTLITIGKHLKENNVKFQTEVSEAGWVTRLLIKKDVETHNNLLTKLEL